MDRLKRIEGVAGSPVRSVSTLVGCRANCLQPGGLVHRSAGGIASTRLAVSILWRAPRSFSDAVSAVEAIPPFCYGGRWRRQKLRVREVSLLRDSAARLSRDVEPSCQLWIACPGSSGVPVAPRRGNVGRKDTLMDAVWPGRVIEERNISVHLSALRRALGEDATGGALLRTDPGAAIGSSRPSVPATAINRSPPRRRDPPPPRAKSLPSPPSRSTI